MTTQTQPKTNGKGAPSATEKPNLKVSKPTEKQPLTAEERAEKIGYLAKGKAKRDQIIETRKELENMKFGSEPDECELILRSTKNGEKFHTTNPRIAEIFVNEAIYYCNNKLLEVDQLIETELKNLIA